MRIITITILLSILVYSVIDYFQYPNELFKKIAKREIQKIDCSEQWGSREYSTCRWEQRQMKEAIESYEILLQKMKWAIEQGSSKIAYSPMYVSLDKVIYSSDYFPIHEKWLHEGNDNIVVWIKLTSSYFSTGPARYDLYWREKYLHEKIISNISKYFEFLHD